MKLLSALILLLSLSTSATAQTALDEQITLTRQAAQTDRKAILLSNVSFNDEESELFWPKWDEYRAAAEANGDRLLALIKDYAENYNNMTNQKADELMSDHFSIEMQDVVIRQNFAKEISGFMPARKVMRIVQVENKLDAAIDLQLASEIPLAK